MAGITDKFSKTFNSVNPNVALVTGSRAAAGTTLACDNLAGWPTDTVVHFSTYQVDTGGAVVAGTQIDWKGIVSGNNIGSLTRVAGATDAGSSINDIVEMNPTATWANELAIGLLVAHDQDGTLKAGAVDTSAVMADGIVTNAKLSTTAGEPGAAWTTYTATLVGWSGTPTQTCRSKQIGKTAHLIVNIAGTSNATTATVSLPFTASASMPIATVVAYTNDGSSDRLALARILPSGTTAQIYLGFGVGVGGSPFTAWAASGVKNIQYEITYETV